MIKLILLAGFGWLLRTPPIKTSDGTMFEVDEKEPYTQWEQYRAYDTARDCETGKQALKDQAILAMVNKEKQEKQVKAQEPEPVPDGFRPSPYLVKLQSELNAT